MCVLITEAGIRLPPDVRQKYMPAVCVTKGDKKESSVLSDQAKASGQALARAKQTEDELLIFAIVQEQLRKRNAQTAQAGPSQSTGPAAPQPDPQPSTSSSGPAVQRPGSEPPQSSASQEERGADAKHAEKSLKQQYRKEHTHNAKRTYTHSDSELLRESDSPTDSEKEEVAVEELLKDFDRKALLKAKRKEKHSSKS